MNDLEGMNDFEYKLHLITLASNREWTISFAHWGEYFVHCMFPEIDPDEAAKHGIGWINGVPFIEMRNRLWKREDAEKIVNEHNTRIANKEDEKVTS